MAQRIVGLDIGTSALRAIELVVDGANKPILEAYGQVGLAPGVIVDGEIRDRSQVTAALRRLWREGGFRTTKVQLGVAGLRAITRELELPPLPPSELDDAVNLQAEDVVPFPMERTSLASSVVSRTTDSDGMPLIRVLVAAAHRDLIDGVIAAVEDAGLEPVGIDLDTAALSRAFTLPGGTDEPEAVVSIGAGLTMVIVHIGGSLQFVRTIDLGGDAVTHALAGALDVPFVDAETLKRRLGEPGHHDPRVLNVAGSVVDELVNEIHNSIRYYAALPGRVPPVRVLTTGGGSRTVGLFSKVQQVLDIPLIEASPLSFVDFSRLGITPGEAAAINPTMAVPLGLALNGPTRTKFDLMPREVSLKHAERKVRRLLVLGGIGLVLILAAASAWRLLAVRSAENQVATFNTTVNLINNVEIPKYDKAVRITNEVTSLQHALLPLVSHEVDWLVVLNQVGQYIPPTAVLQGVDLSATTPTGAGTTGTSGTATTRAIGTGTTTAATKNLTEVTQFGLTVAKSPALSQVSLSGPVASAGPAASAGSNAFPVTFPVTFSITPDAHGQRSSLFTQPIP